MRRYLHLLLIAAGAFGALVLALAVLLFAVEFTLPLDGYREQAAETTGRALNAEVRIDGSLRLFTGPRAGVEVERLHIAGKTVKGRWSAEAGRARLRLHPLALFTREIRVTEAAAEEATLCVSPGGGAESSSRAPSQQHPKPAWRVTAIDSVKIGRASIVIGEPCAMEQRVAEITSLEASAPAGGTVRVATHGMFKDQAWRAELHGPLLALLSDASLPLPFEFTGEFAGARLRAVGTATLQPLAGEADVALDTDQLATPLALLGAPLKDFGPLTMRAHLRADAVRQTLRIDEAKLASGIAAAELMLDWSGPRPRVNLSARSDGLDAIELHSWLAQSIDPARVLPGKLVRTIVAGVRASEGELAITVGRLSAGGVALNPLDVAGGWREGKARATIAARLGKRPLKGTFQADVRNATLALAAEAGGNQLELPYGAGIAGTVGKLQAHASARGTLGDALRRSLRADLVVQSAKLEVPLRDGVKSALAVDSARIAWQARDMLRAVLAGTVFNQRFNTRIEGADASKLLQGDPWPLRATGAFGRLRVETAGSVALRNGKALADLGFAASAQSLGSLAGHNKPLAKLPLEAKGHAALTEGDWRVDLAFMRLGRTRGHAQASGSVPFDARPIGAEISFDVLDLAELTPLAGATDAWERELLPRVALPAADFAVSAARIVLPGGKSVQAQAGARTRGGRLEQAPFALTLDGASIKGTLAADLQPAAAQFSATLEASGLEARHLDAQLPKAGVRIKIGNATLTAIATGNRLRELAANAVLRAEAREIQIAFDERGARHALAGSLATASVSAAAGQSTTLTANGAFAGQPLALEASTAPLSALLPSGNVPFSAAGTIAGADVTARGQMRRSGTSPTVDFDLRVATGRLDALNALLDTNLPPLGPLALDVGVRIAEKNAASANVKMTLGESRIAAQISRRRIGNRPSFEADLTAPLLRLEDLGSEYWTKNPEQPKGGQRAAGKKPSAQKVAHAEAIGTALRSALRDFDARLRLVAERVTAAGADYGRIDAAATLDAGRLRMVPVRLTAQSAMLEVNLDADISTEPPRYRLETTLDEFHYGKLLKSMDPKSDDDGSLSLKLNLAGRGKLHEIAPTLEGQVDFVAFPRGPNASVLDRWGGGFLRRLAPAMDSAKGSGLNCAVAGFDVGKGRAKSAALMVDSTRVRAAGKLEIDLASGALKGIVAPKPKRAELFSTLLPLEIGGTLTAPKIGVSSGGLVVSAARLFYFEFAYLYDAAASGRLAADGRDDCIAAYNRLAR